MLLLIAGLALLVFATFHFFRGEIFFGSRQSFWFREYLYRDAYPVIYWCYLAVEVLIGLGLVIFGAAKLSMG